MNSGYGPALRRFWWVVAVGAIFAILAAVLMAYSVEAAVPPKLTEREQPVYTAEARLFVTSGQAPYLRTSVTRFEQVPIGAGESAGAEATFSRITDPPDVKTLVDAANVYPLLIVSDEVSQLREKMYGSLPGEVNAQTIFATATASRYQPSQIPVIELFGTADTPEDARALAAATSKAFRQWIIREQDRAKIEPEQRILIQELAAPGPAFATGGGGIGLPVLALLAIITAFGAVAIMLDRMYPRPRDDDASSGQQEASSTPGADPRDRDPLDRTVISETG
jgi:hypothetical protein